MGLSKAGSLILFFGILFLTPLIIVLIVFNIRAAIKRAKEGPPRNHW